MLLPPDPLNLLEVPVWRWSWILGFSLALCLQTDAGGSGCLGSLSGALLGSPDRGLLWVPRGQNRCCPPLTGQGSELSWLTELAGTCLYSLMQADLRVSHFNCYSGLGKKKKGNAWKKRNASAYFRKKICSIICIEENARKTVQLSLFSLLFERASSTLQLLSYPSCKFCRGNPVRDAWKAPADLSYYTKMSGQDQLLPGTHLHSQPMQIPLKGPL